MHQLSRTPTHAASFSITSGHPVLEKHQGANKRQSWKFWKRHPKKPVSVVPEPKRTGDELRNAQNETLRSIQRAADEMATSLSTLCVAYPSTIFDRELSQLRADAVKLSADTAQAISTAGLSRALVAMLYARKVQLSGRSESLAVDMEIYTSICASQVDTILKNRPVPLAS